MDTERAVSTESWKIFEGVRLFLCRQLPGDYTRVLLLSILTLGLIVRLAHFQTLTETAFLKIPLVFTQSDMYAYWQWARSISAGDLFGRATYHPYFEWMQAMAPLETWFRWWGGKEIFQQAPLYPYWLAGIRAVSNNSIEFAIFIQLVLGALQPLVMYCLARRIFNVHAGLVAAAMTAFYGPFIFQQGALLRDWIPPVLEPLALLALLKAQASKRRVDWCLAGLTLGLALLAKETILLFLPVALGWILLANRAAIKQAVTAMGLVAFGLLLILSPLVVRNAMVGAPLLAISNRAAEGFIEGNTADSFPLGLFHPPSMKMILERSNGRMFSVIKEILHTYAGNPWRFVHVQLLKLRGIADPFEIPNNLNFSYGLEISPILRFTLGYGVIVPLAVVGFLCSLRGWRTHILLCLFGLTAVAGLMSTIILGRYRLTLVPVLIVYAAITPLMLINMMRQRQWVRAMALPVLIMGVTLIQNWLLPIPILRAIPALAIHRPEYLLSARVYAAEGKYDQALAELSRLHMQAKKYTDFSDEFLELSLNEGDYRAAWAMRLLEDANWQEARKQLALAEAAYANHLHLSGPHYNLGLVYLKLSESSKARSLFERFLEGEPQGIRADYAKQILSGLRSTSSSYSSSGKIE
ncbi:MAG TPA: glycosyltransferase family 39 protein [Candidatus Tectomicrobia bacterium]|nr:glycosyltransferase family 39 protein [Candidatus Tectomicrobia bacterium]